MRIVGLSVVRNEMDIIESMVRHNLGFLDHLHLVNNHSSDKTAQILAALLAEFPGRLTVATDLRLDHPQTRLVNELLPVIAERHSAEQVVPLDADEFIRADPDHFRTTLLNGGVPLSLPWVTYVPTPEDDASQINPIRRIRHRRDAEYPQFNKTTVPRSLIGIVRVSEGCHWLENSPIPAQMVPGLTLAHFPVRSADQLMSKVLIGAWSRRLRKVAAAKQGGNWRTMADRIIAGNPITPDDVRDAALTYAARGTAGITFDPLVSPCSTALLFSSAGETSLTDNLVAFTEMCIRQVEAEYASRNATNHERTGPAGVPSHTRLPEQAQDA